jgi:predicted transposase YbfD/YdcC
VPHPKKVSTKSNEIKYVEPLLKELSIEGKVITADALLTQKDICKFIVEEKKADYLFTVKDNQLTLKKDIEDLNLESEKYDHITVNKGHGRVETRKIWCSTMINSYVEFPHVNQVFCIQRERYDQKKETTTNDTVYGITSQTTEKASPEKLLSQNRGHWAIENKVHYVLDVSFDEDRSQIRFLNGPMVMTCLRKLAITILRKNNFCNIAEAFRKLWAKPHLALNMVFT